MSEKIIKHEVQVLKEKPIARIVRLAGLLVVKELVLLLKNIYGLIFWPGATIRGLWGGRDKSQLGLLVGLLMGPLVTASLLLSFVLFVERLMGWKLYRTKVLGLGVWVLALWGLLVVLGWAVVKVRGRK